MEKINNILKIDLNIRRKLKLLIEESTCSSKISHPIEKCTEIMEFSN